MSWQEEYQRKLVSAEEAAKSIKSGNRVACTSGREPLAIGLALAARKEELKGVQLLLPTPTFDFGWYDPGWEDSFNVQVAYIFPRGVARECMDDRRGDHMVGDLFLLDGHAERWKTDVLLTEVSPPDEHGFCSFGASLYDKRHWVRNAKTVLAEVNDHLIRTYGDNFVHVSQIDYFVEHPHTGRTPGTVDLSSQPLAEPSAEVKCIAQYASTLIDDGDTVQVGAGGTSEALVRAGLLAGKQRIGWHSEVTPAGIIKLVREGTITGECKSVDRGKAVATAIGGGSVEDMRFVNNNPLFELRDVDYTHNPKTISALDNMVAINNVLAVDLTGQVSAESMGPRVYSGAGGLLAFAVGTRLSHGGRFIVVLPATAGGGTISRIVPMFEQGTIVTVPRILTDIVITEYGIARLQGKTQRQRAQELIAIARPDFRAELERQARRLYWP